MTRTITVKISRPLAARLSAAVRRRGRSRSAIVREALEGHLQPDRPDSSGSFLEQAGDLIGSVAAAADLSTNRKHLRGYGR